MNETGSIENYRENADQLWTSGSSEVFSNGRTEHAAVLYETFLRRGEKEILMFVRNMSKDVFGKMESLTKDALDRGLSIKIICQENPESKKAVENIEKWKLENKKIDLKVCPEGSPASGFAENFAVVDGRAFRFERDRSTHAATACMNDPKTAQLLAGMFSRIERSLTATS